MMKVLITLTAIVALCSGQATNLTNVAELDPAGNFRLSWEVLSGPGDIVMQFQANTTGWISLLIASADSSYADVIFCGHDDTLDDGYLEDMHFNLTSTGGHLLPEADASRDYILQGSVFHDPWTIVRVKRSLNTGDNDDVTIMRGAMTLGWSFSPSDSADSVHSAAGFATVSFIP